MFYYLIFETSSYYYFVFLAQYSLDFVGMRHVEKADSNSQRFPRLYLLSAGTEGGTTTMLFKSSSIECGSFPGRTYGIFPSVL